MGDPRRFDRFADALVVRWPDPRTAIADVAGGHGQLRAALYRRGHQNAVTFDKRRGRWKPPGQHYRWGMFTGSEPDRFDLLVGMHPDAATDRIIAGAIRRQIPFAVVPCCAIPSVWPFEGPDYSAWVDHLTARAADAGYRVTEECLPIQGRSLMLVGEVS